MKKERFEILAAFPPNRFSEGAPLLINGGHLLKDNYSGATLAHFSFQNLGETPITELKVTLTAADPVGRELKPVLKYRYTGLNAGRDERFGSKTAITLPFPNVATVLLEINELVFSDGTVTDLSGKEFISLGEKLPLSAFTGDEESAKQFAIRYGEDCRFAPDEFDGLWFCACGAVNLQEEKLCHSCRRSLSFLRSVNVASLKDDSDERVVQEAETEITEKETRRSVNTKRIILAVAAAAVLMIIIACLSLIPGKVTAERSYQNALTLLSEGRLDEAERLLSGLGSYQDAEALLTEELPLRKAELVEQAAATGDRSAFDYAGISRSSVNSDYEARIALYEAAITMYRALPNADQYADRIAACETGIAEVETAIADEQYDAAAELLAAGKYLAAHDAFLAMNGYRDSAGQASEALYQRALALYNFAATHETQDVRATLSGETSVYMTELTAKALGAAYLEDLQAVLLNDGLNTTLAENLEAGNGTLIDEIAAQFEALGDYKNSAEMLEEVKALGDYTSKFYAMLSAGELEAAHEWLQNYTGEIEHRAELLMYLPAYACYLGDWNLFSGDPTLLPLTVSKSKSPNAIHVSIRIEDDQAIMTITAGDDISVELTSSLNANNFTSPIGNATYHVYINSRGRFVYAKFAAGTDVGACEYSPA